MKQSSKILVLDFTQEFSLYGTVLFMAAIADLIPIRVLLSVHDNNPTLAIALGQDFKGKISVVIYAIAILLAFVNSWVACILYSLVAIMGLMLDRRIEKVLSRT